MANPNQSEVRVALLGHASVEKAAVLNVLLGGKVCTKVSKEKSNTVVVDFFKVVDQPNHISNGISGNEDFASVDAPSSIHHGNMASTSPVFEQKDEQGRPIDPIITVEERHFVVKPEQTLLSAQDNASLVVINIPSIDDSGARNICDGYVKNNWPSFDCVIIVVDAGQDTSTDEGAKMWTFVEERNRDCKSIPILLIVRNQVGEMQLRSRAEQILGVGCDTITLDQIKPVPSWREFCNGGDAGHDAAENIVAVIPFSAELVLSYLSTFGLTLDEFSDLINGTLIEVFGREVVSRSKWKKMTKKEKLGTAYKASQDPELHKQRLAATNLDCFLSVLGDCLEGGTTSEQLFKEYCKTILSIVSTGLASGFHWVHARYVLMGRPFNAIRTILEPFLSILDKGCGGKNLRLYMIRKQLEIELDAITSAECLAPCLRGIHNKCRSIAESSEIIKRSYWKFYDASRAKNLSFQVCHSGLVEAMDSLSEYGALAKELGWHGECDKVLREMELMVQAYLKNVLAEFHCWDIREWYAASRSNDGIWKDAGMSWKMLSPKDWRVILGSILLCTSEKYCVEWFGHEIVRMTEITRSMFQYCTAGNRSLTSTCTRGGFCKKCVSRSCGCHYISRPCGACENCNTMTMLKHIANALMGAHEIHSFVPVNVHDYSCVARVEMPKSPSQPEHFGYVIWKYCRYCELLQI